MKIVYMVDPLKAGLSKTPPVCFYGHWQFHNLANYQVSELYRVPVTQRILFLVSYFSLIDSSTCLHIQGMPRISCSSSELIIVSKRFSYWALYCESEMIYPAIINHYAFVSAYLKMFVSFVSLWMNVKYNDKVYPFTFSTTRVLQ